MTLFFAIKYKQKKWRKTLHFWCLQYVLLEFMVSADLKIIYYSIYSFAINFITIACSVCSFCIAFSLIVIFLFRVDFFCYIATKIYFLWIGFVYFLFPLSLILNFICFKNKMCICSAMHIQTTRNIERQKWPFLWKYIKLNNNGKLPKKYSIIWLYMHAFDCHCNKMARINGVVSIRKRIK